MLKIFSIGLAVIALCLAATGCSTEPANAQARSARSKDNPRVQINHYDDPIIIDNPEGVVSLVPATGHDAEFAGPIVSEIKPNTSTALVLDHVGYKYIRVNGKTRELGTDKRVVIDFDVFEGGAAGTLTISFLSELNVIALVSTDSGKQLRWQRATIDRKLGEGGAKTLGLVSLDPAMKYVIAKVTYYGTNDSEASESFLHDGPEPTEVQISLCVDEACTFGN